MGPRIESICPAARNFSLTLRLRTRDIVPEYQRNFGSANGTFSIMDIPHGTYDVTVDVPPDSSYPSYRTMRFLQVEIREGYFYGEILIQLPASREDTNHP